MGVTELADSTGLCASDAHRILRSLEQFGYIQQDHDTKKYRLGLELLKLGHVVHEQLELRQVARPCLRHLSEAARATANLAILDEHDLEVVFVDQVDSPEELQIRLRVGKRVPAHGTAVGKALLANTDSETVRRLLDCHGMPRLTRDTITDRSEFEAVLDHVRKSGFATDHGEGSPGAWCIGAPVFDHTGRVVAAVSVSMMAAHLGYHDEPRVIGLVKATAADISAALGYEPCSHAARNGAAR
jgi:DNA-binding IclR family transcriptional regulator